MNFFRIFLICLLLQNLIVNALYLKRMQRSTQKFTKKHIFRPLSRLNRRFFTYFFSPKIKKQIYKKPQVLKSVSLNQSKNFLQKKKLNLKTSIKRYYQESGDYEKVKNSLSFKYAQAKSLKKLKDFFEGAIYGRITDMNFAMKEVTKALGREQIAQKDKKFIGYHCMSAPIFLMMNVYTKIYDKVHNQITPEHFSYLRTFESVSDQEGLKEFLEHRFINPFFNFTDRHFVGRKHLLSLSPFLFQSKLEESALGRSVPHYRTKEIINNILLHLLSLFEINGEEIDIFKLYHFGGNKEIILQIIFNENEKNELGDMKNKFKYIDAKEVYVGVDENHIIPNLYWSGPVGIPATPLPYRSEISDATPTGEFFKYSGPEMFQKMLKEEKTPAADVAQLRLLITPEYLKEKKYRVHIVDINNQFQDFEQKVNELTNLILKEVATQKTNNSSIIKD